MRLILGLSVLLLAISGCGNFCVGPIGNIAACYGTATTTSGGGIVPSTLYIAVTPSQYQGFTAPAGTPLTLNATNGTSGAVFSWTMTVGSPAPATSPTLTCQSGSYPGTCTGTSATFNSTAGQTASFSITVTDGSTGKTYTYSNNYK